MPVRPNGISRYPEDGFIWNLIFEWKVKVKWSRYMPGVAHRVGRGIAVLFHDRGTRRGWVVSSTPRPHFTPGKRPSTHFIGGWVGPRAGLDGRKISSPPGFNPRTVQPVVSRYTDWATRPTLIFEYFTNSGKYNRYLTWKPMYIYGNILLNSSWNEKCFR